MTETEKLFRRAMLTRDVEEFLSLVFPNYWKPVAARILETGVEFASGKGPWAPRWSKVPLTVREGNTDLETYVKSCIFRVHDFIHQLWGLPIPLDFSEEQFYIYKRAQMCGEVAVLTLTEFEFCSYLWKTFPEIQPLINRRNAIPMMQGPLEGKNILQIALRLDDLLHKKSRPKWVRDHKPSSDFVDDYVPMLQYDRDDIDHNWKIMKSLDWKPTGAPDARYNVNLDGLELTTWMINDFYHQMMMGSEYDKTLREFNIIRRSNIVLPVDWHLKKQS